MKAWSSWELVRSRAQQLAHADFLNMRAFGFAAARAWVYLLFLGTGTSMVTLTGEPLPPAAFIGSTVCLCFTLFASALRSPWFYRALEKPWFASVGPTVTAAGTLCLASSALAFSGSGTSFVGNALLAVGAATTGIGSGLIDLCYGELYRDAQSEKTGFEIPFAFFLASLVYAIATMLPVIVSVLLTTALPVFSGFALLAETSRTRISADGANGAIGRADADDIENPMVAAATTAAVTAASATPAAAPIPTSASTSADNAHTVVPELDLGRYAWKIGICACLVGLADGVVRAVFLLGNGPAAENLYLVPLPVSNALTLVVIYACILFTRTSDLRPVYRSVVLIMAVFFMLLPVFTGYSDIECTLALTGYGTFNALIWILIAGIAQRHRFSGVVVFGIGWGMVSLGTLLGQSAGTTLCEIGAPFSPQTLSLIALLATVCILVSYMFVFNESDIKELVKSPETQEVRRQRFQERCRSVAEHCKLTPKETEIMILYAKGRTSKHIQEELFISRGTVTTHLRHIYQKLNVHDKQELIDRIESWGDSAR